MNNSQSTENFITLCQGDAPLTYALTHSDGRKIDIKTDWQWPCIASLMGWHPCSQCLATCRDDSDGTIDCTAKTALDHILNAFVFLDCNIGKRIPDNNNLYDFLVEANDGV